MSDYNIYDELQNSPSHQGEGSSSDKSMTNTDANYLCEYIKIMEEFVGSPNYQERKSELDRLNEKYAGKVSEKYWKDDILDQYTAESLEEAWNNSNCW